MEEEKGLRYNEGKPQWSLMHWKSIEPMIQVLMYGAHKYSVFENDKGEIILGKDVSVEDSKKLKLISSGRDNWKKGFPESELWDSFLRHTAAILDGEELDKESGLPHIGHQFCNLLFISYKQLKDKGLV
jgi:hypothetical protein